MSRPPALDALFARDGYLRPFEKEICRRYEVFQQYKAKIEECGGEDHFTSGYRDFGLVVQGDNSVRCHEWAPGADGLALVGDFNGWNEKSHQYTRGDHVKWTLTVPALPDGSCPIAHGSFIKIAVTKNGKTVHKLSPWARYVTRPKDSIVYHQPHTNLTTDQIMGVNEFYNPPEPYRLSNPRPTPPASLRIYEAHVGISSLEGKVNTYRAFADDVLPRIKRQGYNAVQLMAVMEHVYYASFGYQVTNFFAASSRCGTPEDMKYLVDKAHGLGLFILLDVVHSHASKNVADGLNEWDGTPRRVLPLLSQGLPLALGFPAL